MKKIVAAILAAALFTTLYSCQKIDKDVTGEVQTDVGNESKNDQNENTPSQTDKETGTAPEAKNALTLIQEIGANVTETDPETKTTAQDFLSALMVCDGAKLSEFAGGTPEQYESLKGVKIAGFTLQSFDFSDEFKNKLNSEGRYIGYGDMYIATMDVTESNNDKFTVGTNNLLLAISNDNASGYPVCCFRQFEKAKDSYIIMNDQDKYDIFIDQFSSLGAMALPAGRSEAAGLDLSESAHLITHLCNIFTEQQPPYSMNEVNSFISRAFDGNKGIGTSAAELWTSYYRNTHSDETFDFSSYVDMDKKMFGCSLGHGGKTMVYNISEKTSDTSGKTIVCDYYADFAELTRTKTLTYHFDNEKAGFPCLYGIDTQIFSDYETASISV